MYVPVLTLEKPVEWKAPTYAHYATEEELADRAELERLSQKYGVLRRESVASCARDDSAERAAAAFFEQQQMASAMQNMESDMRARDEQHRRALMQLESSQKPKMGDASDFFLSVLQGCKQSGSSGAGARHR